MVFWCRLFLSIAAISTSAAGPLDKSIKDLGHGLEARVNLDTSDEFPSSGDPTTDYDSILPFDTGSLSDSFLPVDSSTNLGQSLPTVPYLMSAGLSNPEGSYHPDGSNQVPDLTVAGGILFAQAGKESFQCTLNSVICCKGQSDGKVKPCHFWNDDIKKSCTSVGVWNSCCSFWDEVDNESDEKNHESVCFTDCSGDEKCKW